MGIYTRVALQTVMGWAATCNEQTDGHMLAYSVRA